MYIVRVSDGVRFPAVIEIVNEADFKTIKSKRYAFNWKTGKNKIVYKLAVKDQPGILGLVSIEYVDNEKRIGIRLLAVSDENMGHDKLFDRIAGNLIAYVARLAVKKYGADAAVSLVPKTILAAHYMQKYGFEQAGRSLFIADNSLWKLLKEYDYDK